MIEVESCNETRDGALSEDALGRMLRDRGFEVSRPVYPPATFFPRYPHAADKIDVVRR